MTSMMNNTLKTAKCAMESATEGAEHAVDSAKDGAEKVVSGARSTLNQGIHAVTDLVVMLKSLGLDDGLAWIGLARRPSAFRTLAVFGAGLVVGAGAGILFAPLSGADTRRAILNQLKGVQSQAKDTLEQAETEVKQAVGEKANEIAGKANDFAGKARDAVKTAERKVENKVDEGAQAVKNKVEATADAVTDTLDDAKARLRVDSAASASNDPGKATRPNAGQGTGRHLS